MGIQPFTFEISKKVSKNLIFKDGIVIHPLFYKLTVGKTIRQAVFALADLLDGETGLVSQDFSDGRVIPLSEKQISYALGKDMKKIIGLLVSYGVLAEIRVSKTKMYLINPFVVTRGLTANGFLFKVFNKNTLTRFDEYEEYFKKADEAEFKKFWERLED